METALLKAHCAGCQRNRTAEELVRAVLSLATCIRYKSGQWVNHTVLCTPSSIAAHHARDLRPGDGIKGEQRDSDAEVGGGKKKTTFPRQGGARQYRPLCSKAHAFSSAPGRSRRIASTASMRCPIQRMTGTAIELPRAL
jgi:hypothetical protein